MPSKPALPIRQPGHPLLEDLELAILAYEGAGATARDVSGRGNHGALQGGVSWVTGRDGPALDFGGVDGIMPCGDVDIDVSTAGNALSLVALVYPRSLGGGSFSGGSPIVAKAEGGVEGTAEWVWQFEGTDGLYFRTFGGNNGGTPDVWTNDEWQTASLVWRVGSSVTTYRNETEIDSTAVTDTSANLDVPFKAGAWPHQNNYLDGRLAILMAYSRALPASQIRALHADPYAAFRPVRRWWAVALDVAPAFVPQVYTADVRCNPSPVASVRANPSPTADLKSNPSPTVEVKSG